MASLNQNHLMWRSDRGARQTAERTPLEKHCAAGCVRSPAAGCRHRGPRAVRAAACLLAGEDRYAMRDVESRVLLMGRYRITEPGEREYHHRLAENEAAVRAVRKHRARRTSRYPRDRTRELRRMRRTVSVRTLILAAGRRATIRRLSQRSIRTIPYSVVTHSWPIIRAAFSMLIRNLGKNACG